MSSKDLDVLVEEYHRGLDTFMRGNAEPVLALFSHRDDVTLGNPFGPMARGFEGVSATARAAASHMRDGRARGFERIATHVSSDFAYIVEVERLSTKLNGAKEISPFSLRVTTIFLPENGSWKVTHRHADPITTARPWDSVIEK